MLRATKHLLTEIDAQKIKRSDAEVCFLGRSNAGKSTLINALCQRKKLAFVSQVPGKTRAINVYEVKLYRWIVDLPGYGYAVGSRKAQDTLGAVIEGYLTNRKDLSRVLVVIDALVGPTELDRIMIRWLKHFGFSFRIVANKIDKVGPSKLEARKAELAHELAVPASDIFWVSSKKNTGMDALRTAIAQWLGL